MDRSSSTDATASCSKLHAHRNASLTSARSFPFLTEHGANRVEIVECRKVFECLRQQAFAPKQLEQSPRAGCNQALEHRWRHDGTGVDQQLRALGAREVPLSLRIEAVAIGPRGESEQSAIAVTTRPGQQRRKITHELR
jgi:hypothetical protein